MLHILAHVLEKQDRVADAEAMFKDTIRLKEKLHGRDLCAVAATVNNLALFYVRNFPEQYDEAEAMYSPQCQTNAHRFLL